MAAIKGQEKALSGLFFGRPEKYSSQKNSRQKNQASEKLKQKSQKTQEKSLKQYFWPTLRHLSRLRTKNLSKNKKLLEMLIILQV